MTKQEAMAIMYGYSQDYLDHLREKASRLEEIGNWFQPDIDRLKQALDVIKGDAHGKS